MGQPRRHQEPPPLVPTWLLHGLPESDVEVLQQQSQQ